MNSYYNKQIPGELWLRDLSDNVSPAHEVLSSIYLKYQTINNSFFTELTSNKINRFDVIYDVIFLETKSGYIFEKFYIDTNSQIKPYNQLNLFNTRKNTTTDYWYSETANKIYFVELFYTQPSIFVQNNTFDFNLIFKSFDCFTGKVSVILLKKINLVYTYSEGWRESEHSFVLENPKLTYNSDTKTFNVSFILRNSKGSFGLMSLNILDLQIPQVSEVNGFLPFFVIDANNSYVTDWTQVEYNNYYDFITEFGEFILTENFVNLKIES